MPCKVSPYRRCSFFFKVILSFRGNWISFFSVSSLSKFLLVFLNSSLLTLLEKVSALEKENEELKQKMKQSTVDNNKKFAQHKKEKEELTKKIEDCMFHCSILSLIILYLWFVVSCFPGRSS
jgi:hypothetical protein